jgi:cell division protein FtsL
MDLPAPPPMHRVENRNTILINKLTKLWDYNRCLYILVFVLIFLVAISIIIYVLKTSVLTSQRYNFLEQKEN